MKRYFGIIIGVSILSCLLMSCTSVPYPDRQQYLFVLPTPTTQYPISDNILEISNIAIAPQFSGTNFIYRTSDTRYLTDYYHTFFTPPEYQIRDITMRYLKASKLFPYITLDDDFNHSQYRLHITVLDLYADYRNSDQPMAVLSIQFTLFRLTDKKNSLVFDEAFQTRIPLNEKTSEQLMQAWNEGLAQTLAKLTNRLAQITTDKEISA